MTLPLYPCGLVLNHLQNHILNFLELSTNKYEMQLNGLPIHGGASASVFRDQKLRTAASNIDICTRMEFRRKIDAGFFESTRESACRSERRILRLKHSDNKSPAAVGRHAFLSLNRGTE
ncbi:hypothetical protein G6M50_00575 [Agrobacterium rhizogenes]|nr:hypothetical protein [Rhizobium rhizogenes]